MATEREIGDVVVRLANGQEERFTLKTTGELDGAEAALTYSYDVTDADYLVVTRHSVLVEGWESATALAGPQYSIRASCEVSRYRPDAWMSVRVE